MLLFLTFFTSLHFLYYCSLFLRGGSDDVRDVLTLTISKFAVLAGNYYSLHAVEGAPPDYFVSSLYFDHVGVGMLFWLPTPIPTVLIHFSALQSGRKTVHGSGSCFLVVQSCDRD